MDPPPPDASPPARLDESGERGARWVGRSSALAIPLAISLGLMWLAFPPVGWWPLGWLAPVPLISVITRPRLPGWRPGWVLYFGGIGYWLATFYFVPLPHPALWLGWLVLAIYLGAYLPLTVWASRVLHFRWRVPWLVAIPLAWMSAEWIRCHFLTGMGLVCLSHSQFRQPLLIQIADLGGAYLLTLAMVAFAAGVAQTPLVWGTGRVRSIRGPIAAAVILAGVVGYGLWTAKPQSLPAEPRWVIGLIQGSVDTRLGDRENELLEKYEQYRELTWEARRRWPDLDGIVWPEANLPYTDLLPDADSPELPDDAQARAAAGMHAIWAEITGYPRPFSEPVWLVTGAGSTDFEDRFYNAAILFDCDGVIIDRYFKNHRVMYGEYYPVLNWIPAFHRQMPGITAGDEPAVFEIEGLRLAPLICFETTVPHLVRQHVATMTNEGKPPHALLNLTNDGWFFGTACLDFHLACNVMRAVEMRIPNLVVANTGFSAQIDSRGRLEQVGPRRATGILRAELSAGAGNSLYRQGGHWVPLLMTLWTVAAVVGSLWRKPKPAK